MKRSNHGIEFAIEVFARGHSAGRSRTFPYEVSRVGPLWVMRDALRKNPCDYRKEEWIAHDVDPREVDAMARRHRRGRFFVCAMIAEGEPDGPTRTAYKTLGYRLLATEGFFMQPMKRIPKPPSSVSIERVRTPDLAAQLGKITRTRPISNDLLRDDAPFRQYVALDGGEGACAAWTPWEPRGARTCMFARRTGGAASARRCCQKCCGTTGPFARNARC